ncbi:AAA family ATPase [Sphingomonas sp. OK281]|uniref:AAA family ATPase n=1 Tax=Sphingomonas sp. OK281 TaxID=1881067 RepID=UPI0008F07EC7|nr:AAA family ATPase [Sphingomonas sp. OK281]SFO47735.1 Wobble nucleotide-excising tRNase [Sphingomonas sp. OK281]
MLTAIKKIRNLGVFGDYAQVVGLKEFSRYNLIYGENGAGKTTLSRLFTALNSGAHPEYPLLEFAVDAEGGAIGKGQKSTRKIRVFNSDYVEANIGKFDGPLRPILIVGVENKALAEEVRREQSIYDARSARIGEIATTIGKAATEKGKIFSAVAKTIGEATSGASLRSYRKPDAEKDFVRLQPLKAYSEEELEVSRATLRQKQAAPVSGFALPFQLRDGQAEPVPFVDALRQFSDLVIALTPKTAQEGALQRLVANPDISKWVEEGIRLHRDHSSEVCEYCVQPIPPARIEALAQHFGAADQLLKVEIEAAIQRGRTLAEKLNALQFPAQQTLYSELWKDYEIASAAFEEARTACLKKLGALDTILADKLVRRSTAFEADGSIETEALGAAANQLDGILQRHDIKTAQFDAAKARAREMLERHYLAEIAGSAAEFDQQVRELEAEAKKLKDGAPGLDDARGMEALLNSAKEKRAKVSSEHAGGAEMTTRLRDFLGRTDLEFQSNDEGYRVLRRGKSARRLSEGEKTAIAFLYFVVQLGDHEFDVTEGIVVVDDPISSLDSSAIYQAFASLKNAVKDAKQVFLLTHNFEFLKLLLDWLKQTKKAASYYMIICAETEDNRVARIESLDQMLIDHPTEYHFLFKTLYTFKSNGTIAACYHIPNVARKLLETFLEFHSPSTATMYKQLEAVTFDEDKKTAIYKFTNDHSHRTGKGFDPAIVAESQKNVTFILEMVKEMAPLHYDGLAKLSV